MATDKQVRELIKALPAEQPHWKDATGVVRDLLKRGYGPTIIHLLYVGKRFAEQCGDGDSPNV